jgi:hypothetical protein
MENTPVPFTLTAQNIYMTGLIKEKTPESDVVIPGIFEYGGIIYQTTAIGANAFNFPDVTSVTIPEGVTDIGAYAFWGCWSMESVHFPDTLKDIDGFAFSSCKALKDLILPDGVTHIGTKAFCDCWSLRQVTVPDSVTRMGNAVFKDCRSLEKAVLSGGLSSIEPHMFDECQSLRDVAIPDSITEIGDGAFRNCEGLEYLDIPESVRKIGTGVFDGCKRLIEVLLPKDLLFMDPFRLPRLHPERELPAAAGDWDKDPLKAFAEREAIFRLSQSYMREEILDALGADPSEETVSCLEDLAQERLTDYLMNDETALNYDGMDDVIRDCIDEVAEQFPPEKEQEEDIGD